MIHSDDLEELIADSMTGLLIRADRLHELDQLAISEEFREWLKNGVRLDDVLKLVFIKKILKISKRHLCRNLINI